MKIPIGIIILICLVSCLDNKIEESSFIKHPKREYKITERVVISEFELYLINQGLTNVNNIDPTIVVDLKYATKNNFVGVKMYGDISHAYLQKEVVEMLQEAQENLKSIDSSKSLIIYDAARPHYVQQIMWDSMVMPFERKTKFLSNPRNSSVHNYGAAVDVSIFDIVKQEALDMGSPFDDTTKLAYPTKEKYFLKQGKLTQKHIDNRELLRKVMKEAKFRPLLTEWWHFNAFSRVVAKQKYKLIK